MHINNYRQFGFQIFHHNLRNSVVFKMAEEINDFLGEAIKSVNKQGVEERHTIPSYLPFENTLLEFKDSLIWFTQNNVDGKNRVVISASMLREDYLKTAAALNKQTVDVAPCYTIVDLRMRGQAAYIFDDTPKVVHEDDFTDSLGNFAVCSWYVLQKFLTILSCKNIQSVKNKIKGVKQKAIRQGALFEYYTLQIKGTSSQGDYESGKWHNRIHFVRGHMKEYTDGAPLFGKITGRFWCPPHVRGKNKDGMIAKDYEIDQQPTELK